MAETTKGSVPFPCSINGNRGIAFEKAFKTRDALEHELISLSKMPMNSDLVDTGAKLLIYSLKKKVDKKIITTFFNTFVGGLDERGLGEIDMALRGDSSLLWFLSPFW